MRKWTYLTLLKYKLTSMNNIKTNFWKYSPNIPRFLEMTLAAILTSNLKPDGKSVHRRAYPVPKLHEGTSKKELEHLVCIGVLSPQGSSEWGLRTFITPKKELATFVS
jgi:hypothetical protein